MQKSTALRGPEWTILTVLQWTASYFASRDIESPRAAAEILLAHVLNLSRIDLYVRYDQPLAGSELEQFKVLIKRRINREPVAYILGTKGFWTMDLAVCGDVLIPRPETECLVEAALAMIDEDSGGDTMRILDLGTGSGAIILALAQRHRRHHYFASDRSIRALRIAAENARIVGLEGAIRFFCGDWLTGLGDNIEPLDMIVSNPPYIPKGDLKGLAPEIYRYEPQAALDGGFDGLDCLNQIIESTPVFLKPGGRLLLEIGHDQRQAVQGIIDRNRQYQHVHFLKDYGGYDRVVTMERGE